MLTDISSRNDLVRIRPFGGCGEIGMNLLALEHQDSILLIDCGLMFAGGESWGTDLILPDIAWLREHNERICAIVITHGHEDHIGALPFILRDLGNPPIYATPFSLELIRARLQKRKCSSNAPMHQIQPRESFRCGPFGIEAFSTAHSIPGGVGLAINTAAGCIIHSGDFKLDPSPVDGITTDLATLGRYADDGVLAVGDGREPEPVVVDPVVVGRHHVGADAHVEGPCSERVAGELLGVAEERGGAQARPRGGETDGAEAAEHLPSREVVQLLVVVGHGWFSTRRLPQLGRLLRVVRPLAGRGLAY